MYYIDALLMGNYSKTCIDNFPSGMGIGVLWKVEGIKDPQDGLDTLLKTGRVPEVKIHLMWKDLHDFKSSDIEETVKRAKSVAVFMEKFPSITFYVSPWLENKSDSKLITKVFAAIKAVLPERTKYINSGPIVLKNTLREIHHSMNSISGGYSFSFDGLSCHDADVGRFMKNHKSAKLFAFWDFALNCRYSAKDDVKKRADRKLKPDARHFKSYAMMSKGKGKTSLPSQHLYKAYSDPEYVGKDHSKPLARSWKPLFILSKFKSGTVELKAKDTVVGTFKFDKAYSDGRGIFRSDSWGVEIAEKAVAISGSPLCTVWINGTNIGVVNPVFRQNSYKNDD